MPLPLSIPINIDSKLYALLQEMLRRSADGTVVPLFIDYNNSRVLIGSVSASTSDTGKLEITGGDLKVITAGKGLVIPTRDGLHYYRLIMENNGTLAADLVS